jgi:hypothetical protein
VQITAVLQLPLALHVWTPLLLEHCVVPGTHTPVHDPEMHAELVHEVGAPHVPVVLHVCTPLPAHWVAPGVQMPWQAPLTHADA